MKRILLKHPIFRLVTFTAFKYLLETGKLFHLKPGGYVYREDQPAKANIYFVMYGRYNFTSSKIKEDGGKFGEKLGLGWTVGEEILYTDIDNKDKLIRIENCNSLKDSCLLQVSVADFITLNSYKLAIGGGDNLQKDYETLLRFLE